MLARILLIFQAAIYLAAYHWIYVDYINPVFEYAHHYYYPRELVDYFASYFLALFPLLLYKRGKTPVAFGLALIYVMCYAPAQLTMLFMWGASTTSLMAVSILMSVSMSIMFALSRGDAAEGVKRAFGHARLRADYRFVGITQRGRVFLFAFALIGAITLLAVSWSHMRLVGFEDVYELRFDARDAGGGVVAGYLAIWLSTIVVPFYAAVGIVRKSYSYFGLGAGLALLVYMANGAKGTLLLPFVMVALGYVFGKKIDFLSALLTLSAAALVILLAIDDPAFAMLKAIIVMRTLATGGWTITTYYELFSQIGYTYYTNIGPIGFLTGAYPFGEYSIGQMIGIEYSGSPDANFNANFWASDGIAAMGPIGIVLTTVVLATILLAINRLSRGLDPRFVALWLTGFWLTLLNAPVSTSLISGGGLIILGLLVLFREKTRGRRALRPADKILPSV